MSKLAITFSSTTWQKAKLLRSAFAFEVDAGQEFWVEGPPIEIYWGDKWDKRFLSNLTSDDPLGGQLAFPAEDIELQSEFEDHVEYVSVKGRIAQ